MNNRKEEKTRRAKWMLKCKKKSLDMLFKNRYVVQNREGYKNPKKIIVRQL